MHRLAESFLFREARLLGTERQREWLTTMVHPDIRYTVFSRELHSRKDKRFTGPDKLYLFQDTYESLEIRVKQFETGLLWRADPPERLRHVVTNVEVYLGEREDEYIVHSNCLTVRNRRVYEESFFVFGREDVLRREANGALRLLRRTVDFDQRFVRGRNLLFFL
jgi:naphthalene 1,2-dioxygenase subunit beta